MRPTTVFGIIVGLGIGPAAWLGMELVPSPNPVTQVVEVAPTTPHGRGGTGSKARTPSPKVTSYKPTPKRSYVEVKVSPEVSRSASPSVRTIPSTTPTTEPPHTYAPTAPPTTHASVAPTASKPHSTP